jgi:Leucine-rich repeat (LRR) protein
MFKFIFNVYILILLFNNTKAKIHLAKDNLDSICNCISFHSTSIDPRFKDISTIDPFTFNGLHSLQYLDLYSNQLTTIDPSTFKQLNSLEYLDLGNNQLTKINPSTFNGLNSIQKLELSNNQQIEIDPLTFKQLNLIQILLLSRFIYLKSLRSNRLLIH